jgi:hypothetical protein
MLVEDKASIYSFLSNFLSIVDNVSPSTIISDQRKGTKSAIIELQEQNQFRGAHLFDVWHVMRSIRTANVSLKKQLRKLLLVKTVQEYSNMIDVLLDNAEGEEKRQF